MAERKASVSSLSNRSGSGRKQNTELRSGSVRRSPDLLDDLTALASIAMSLSPQNLATGLDQALDTLREATGMESAELFLAEPIGGDLLLTAYRGPFRNAFYEIVRLNPGEDIPGLVVMTGESFATNALQEDDSSVLR